MSTNDTPEPARSEIASRVASMSYEEARSRLVEIVSRLEQGSIPLEESLRLWEVGEDLARHCQFWLEGATQRIKAAERGETPDQAAQSQPAQQGQPAQQTPQGHPASPTEHIQLAQQGQNPQQGTDPTAIPGANNADKSARLAAIQAAVDGVKAEDVPAVELSPAERAALRSREERAEHPEAGSGAAPATRQESATPAATTEEEDPEGLDFDPTEFDDGSEIDSAPLIRHPEDFE